MPARAKNPIPRFSVTKVISGGFFIFFAFSAFFSTFMGASDEIKEHLAKDKAAAIAVIKHAQQGEAADGNGASADEDSLRIELSLDPASAPFLKNRLGQGMPFFLEILGIVLIVCLSQAYHYPVKRYFRAKRRGRPVDASTEATARARLSRSPIAIGVILPAAMMVLEILMVPLLRQGFAEHGLAMAQLKLAVPKALLAALAGLFMFLWQRHRVQTIYLKHAYSEAELTTGLPPGGRTSIRGTLVLLSVLAAALPAAVIISLFASGFSVIDSDRELSRDEIGILFGETSAPIPYESAEGDGEGMNWQAFLQELKAAGLPGFPLLYFNTLDSWRLVIGMAIGLCIILAYVAAIVRWISCDFMQPLEELSGKMRALTRDALAEPTPVTSNNEIGQLALGFNAMLKGLDERNRIKGLFGQYLTREVSDAILDGRLNLEGDRYQATVMFTDIRDFTEMSESMSPEEVFRFLNGYLDGMIEVIMSKGGFIDKFLGDGILSVFGLPVRGEDHARQAVETAMEMRGRLEAMNAERRAAGLAPIAIGSGIHTGPVIAGNVGNEKRVQFTVIGDTVNLASRLEGLNKRFSSSIILSDATWAALPEELRSRDIFVRLSDVEVRGKREPLTLYKAG